MGSGGGGIRGVAPLFPPTTPLPIHPPHLPISSPPLADPGIREQDSWLPPSLLPPTPFLWVKGDGGREGRDPLLSPPSFFTIHQACSDITIPLPIRSLFGSRLSSVAVSPRASVIDGRRQRSAGSLRRQCPRGRAEIESKAPGCRRALPWRIPGRGQLVASMPRVLRARVRAVPLQGLWPEVEAHVRGGSERRPRRVLASGAPTRTWKRVGVGLRGVRAASLASRRSSVAQRALPPGGSARRY